MKSSVQRGIRQSILDQYPDLEDEIEELLPKKAPLIVVKWCVASDCAVLPAWMFAHLDARVSRLRSVNHLSLVASGSTSLPLFFQVRDGPFVPTLRLLHQFPDMLPKYRVDRGAIRFVLSGANIMAPGLTSAGGAMDDVPADTVVVSARARTTTRAIHPSLAHARGRACSARAQGIFAEGKEHALAIGVTLLSTKEIRETNKGVAVENTHYLNDGLWHLLSID